MKPRWGQWGTWVLIGSIWLYLFPYSASLNNPNERTRVLQARAMAENFQLEIGETFRDPAGRLRTRDLYGRVHHGLFVNDVALVCDHPAEQPPDCLGRLFPAKAPGTALMGVPALALAGWLGLVADGPAGEPAATWVLRYGGVAVFVFLGLLAFAGLLSRLGLEPGTLRGVLLATALGTGLFPYGIMFVGHAAAGGGLLLGIWLLVRAHEAGRRRFWWSLAAGLASAWVVCLEYHAVVAVACIAVWTLAVRDGRRLVPGFWAGALAVMVLFGGLHQAMFGSPFLTGHAFLMSAHNRASQAGGFLGISGFYPGSLRDHLLDPYMGWLPLMPWLVAGGLFGLPALFGRRVEGLPAGLSVLPGAMVLVYLLFVATLGNWRTMNGWSIGPRYLVPASLPLALAAAVGWQRLRDRNVWAGRVMAGLAAASVLIVGILTAAYPQPPAELGNPFGEFALPLLAGGYGVPNLGILLGMRSASLVPAVLLLLVASGLICAGAGASPRARLKAAALSAAVAMVWVASLALIRITPGPAAEAARDFARRTVEGARPDGG